MLGSQKHSELAATPILTFCAPSTANLISVHCGFDATYPSQLYLRNETYEHTFYYIQGLFHPKRWLGWFSVPIRLWDLMCEHMALNSLLALHWETAKGDDFSKSARMPCDAHWGGSPASLRTQCLFSKVKQLVFQTHALKPRVNDQRERIRSGVSADWQSSLTRRNLLTGRVCHPPFIHWAATLPFWDSLDNLHFKNFDSKINLHSQETSKIVKGRSGGPSSCLPDSNISYNDVRVTE